MNRSRSRVVRTRKPLPARQPRAGHGRIPFSSFIVVLLLLPPTTYARPSPIRSFLQHRRCSSCSSCILIVLRFVPFSFFIVVLLVPSYFHHFPIYFVYLLPSPLVFSSSCFTLLLSFSSNSFPFLLIRSSSFCNLFWPLYSNFLFFPRPPYFHSFPPIRPFLFHFIPILSL